MASVQDVMKIMKGHPQAEVVQNFGAAMRDANVPCKARAESATYLINEHGLDLVPSVAEILKEADEGRELKAKAAEEEQHPLAQEVFLKTVELQGRTMAAVTHGTSVMYAPCAAEDIRELQRGDPVLMDVRSGKLVGRDGQVQHAGDVATVEMFLGDGTHRVLVKHHDQSLVAHLAHWLVNDAARPAVGARVVVDIARRMVTEVVKSDTDGNELLFDVSLLDRVNVSDLGAVNPVLHEILFRARCFVEHPDWLERMRVRPVASYFFAGTTGTGKTSLLKVISRILTDDIEKLTGRRLSRLVIADASTFYSAWFGESESRVREFFRKLRILGRTGLCDRAGRPVRVPLLVVFEEAEALLRSRGMDAGGSGHLFDRVLALILQMCSSLGDEIDSPVILCMTSNKPTLLDAAALRRMGMRRVTFGSLTAGQAASILEKKVPLDLPLAGSAEFPSADAARQAAINRILAYLYGDSPEQALAEVRLVDGARRNVHRRNLVTPALLEEGVSAAIDESLRQSAAAGELLGLDPEAVTGHLQRQFESLAKNLRAHNLEDYLPEWFTEETVRVESVRPLTRRHLPG